MTEAEKLLRKLVDLARRANTSRTAIKMADVFDDPWDAKEWDKAWAQARALVSVKS